MVHPWQWARRWAGHVSLQSHQAAVANARAAATELGQHRVERQEVELFLQRHHGRRPRPGLDLA